MVCGVVPWIFGIGWGIGVLTGSGLRGGRLFAVIKWVFGSGHVLVTTVPRVHVKMVFACLCFNLVQLGTLAVGL